MISTDATVNDAKLIMQNRQLYDKLKQMGANEDLWKQAAEQASRKPKIVFPQFKIHTSEGRLPPSEGTLAARIERCYNTLPDCDRNCSFMINDVFQHPVSSSLARILKAVLETKHRTNDELHVLNWLRIILVNYASSAKLEAAQLPSPVEDNLYRNAMVFIKKVLANES